MGNGRSCSALAVRNAYAISHHCLNKLMWEGSSKIRWWWHIVSGNEDDLSQLEKERDSVQLQMTSKLKPCYKLRDDAQPPPFLDCPSQGRGLTVLPRRVNLHFALTNNSSSVLYFNARSIVPQIWHPFLRSRNALTRCYVYCRNSDQELLLSNYQLFQLDRNRHGGAWCTHIYVKLICLLRSLSKALLIWSFCLFNFIALTNVILFYFTVLLVHQHK